jgi:crotonobetainyl-CoA:carnitine CoA-transferase CaiB-like acyl-CoA transferase
MEALVPDSLTGVMTVVELGDSVSASMCGKLLRQLGATVIKVEPADGSPLRHAQPIVQVGGGEVSTLFAYLNAGKKSVTADLASASGRRRIEPLLCDHADVVLVSEDSVDWRREAMPSTARPVVLARVSMFGNTGPYRDYAGGDFQGQAIGGLVNLVGDRDRHPLRLGGSQAQYATGLSMLMGVTIARHRAAITGESAEFSTSVFETIAYLEWKSVSQFQDDGTIVHRGSRTGPMIVRTRDGFLALYYRVQDWPQVKTVLGDPRLDDPRFDTPKGRDQNRDALVEIVESNTLKESKLSLYARAQAAGVPVGYVATMSDLLDSQQYRVRHFMTEIDLGGLGKGIVPGPSWRGSGGPDHAVGAGRVAAIGENDEELLGSAS